MLFSLLFSNPLLFLVAAGSLVVSITIHEFAHAWTAEWLGDPTPRTQDRVTLDPRAHLDPIGTLLILMVGFGWGKPVVFDPYNLKNPVKDAALISLAGPAANLILAGILALLINFTPLGQAAAIVQVMAYILYINVMLAIFNLIPVHPLDGGKILVALLPKDMAYEYEIFMRHYGTYMLLALLIPWTSAGSPASAMIQPIISAIVGFLIG